MHTRENIVKRISFMQLDFAVFPVKLKHAAAKKCNLEKNEFNNYTASNRKLNILKWKKLRKY